MNADAAPATTLVPPYPNLGPEPMSRSYDLPPVWVLLPGLLAVLFAALHLSRIARRRTPTARASGSPTAGLDRRSSADSALDRVVELSDTFRETLVGRFGEAWRAKTTEEIAQEPQLHEALGTDAAGGLLAFLHIADLAKFAGDRLPGYLPEVELALQRAEASAAEWVAALAPAGAAAARSIIKG